MSTVESTPQVIPPLKSGDQLTRDEFERRYDAMPHLKKAELIEGAVYMPSPVSWIHHAGQHANLVTWMGVYKASTPGVDVGDNASVRLDLDNMPQPDAAMIVEPRCGGVVHLSEDDYVVGGPELVGEVAATTVSIDLNAKLRIYRRNQVQEYIVWRVFDEAIDWFVLRKSQYERREPGVDGICKSEVFPGLWLDVAAMTQGRLPRVLEVVQQGIASPEHAAFVAKLREAGMKSP
jgi:hypothetical protein